MTGAGPGEVIAGRAAWALTHGDVLDVQTGLPSLPDKCIAHTFADPPYEAEAHSKGRRIQLPGGPGAGRHSGIMGVAISYDPITPDERDAVAVQINRVTLGWSIVFGQSEAMYLWRASFARTGARYIRTGIYWKDDAQPQYSGDRPGVGFEEWVLHWHDTGRPSWNGGGKCARYRASRDPGAPSTLVDGQKPLSLLVEMESDFANPGDVILSPYGGAGTEMLAALRLGMRAIGWEKKAEHYAIALERLRTGEARPRPGQAQLFAGGAGQ